LPSRERNRRSRRLARLVFILSLAALAVSSSQKRKLPETDGILDELLQEPVQSEADVPPSFEVMRENIRYVIHPRFSYELWGLVVSEHDSRAFSDFAHRKWNDHLNVKDVCVLWGQNVQSGVYLRMKFSSGDVSCFYRYPDPETGAVFNARAMSNNHLLAGDSRAERSVRRVRRGDQIHVRGWLSSYEQPDTGFRRGTSTTRADTGNGACETIYVTDFEIIRPGDPLWRDLFKASLAGILLSALALLLL